MDTFLFDKTGTLTRERPEVARIIALNDFSERQILKWAAAAENKFSHPIAHAILDRFKTLGVALPAVDDSKYKVGYGISVVVEDRLVCVGSARFMQHEGIEVPDEIETIIQEVHAEGHSLIFVGVDGQLGGALEMRAAERPEADAIIKGLRARGAKHIAIISGDHERPTQSLARKLGVDRYFAEVLPEDKAKYVELLQKEGRTVCFVGDGINDSIALRKADVSISLRGASSVATDAAQVVFMEDSLSKILKLHDISRGLQRNITRSWVLIFVPNMFCMVGAFVGGFGVMHSMIFNQFGGLLALGNGLTPPAGGRSFESGKRAAPTQPLRSGDYRRGLKRARFHTQAYRRCFRSALLSTGWFDEGIPAYPAWDNEGMRHEWCRILLHAEGKTERSCLKKTPFRAIVSPLVVRQVLAQSMVRKG